MPDKYEDQSTSQLEIKLAASIQKLVNLMKEKGVGTLVRHNRNDIEALKKAILLKDDSPLIITPLK